MVLNAALGSPRVELGELPAGSLYSDTPGFVFEKLMPRLEPAKLALVFEALALQSCIRMYRI